MHTPLRIFRQLAHIKKRLDHLYVWAATVCDGHILEFGIADGCSTNVLAAARPACVVYGFDMLAHSQSTPALTGESSNSPAVAVACAKQKKNVVLVPGVFEDTLPQWLEHHRGNVSLIHIRHIDSNLYTSARTILFELNHRIVRGTILIFDEVCNWYDPDGYSNCDRNDVQSLQAWQRSCGRRIEPLSRGHISAAAYLVKE